MPIYLDLTDFGKFLLICIIFLKGFCYMRYMFDMGSWGYFENLRVLVAFGYLGVLGVWGILGDIFEI